MRQVVAFSDAINKRKCVEFYSNLCLHAQVNGRQILKSFSEVFPQYTEPQENSQIDEKAAKLMDKLAEENLRKLENGVK